MLIAQRPTLTEEQIGDARSRFVIEPLEPGFGYTIGNSLRRTLLSSIPGAAVTSIRIEGVLRRHCAASQRAGLRRHGWRGARDVRFPLPSSCGGLRAGHGD